MGERCVDCGGRAQEWSFNGDLTEHIIWGPVTRHGEVWIGAWSGDPDAYEPRCKSCHHEFDLDGWRSLRWMLLGGGSEWTEELEERFRDFD
jgi:thymidine kinase